MGLTSKIVLIHADLGEMEWHEMRPWIESISHGIPLHVVESTYTFFDIVRKYKRIPSGQHQFCTDMLKVQPIEAFIHQYMTTHNITHAINATGIRSEESKRRATYKELDLSEMTRPKKHPGHTIHDWRPILNYSTLEVFAEIAKAGQQPHELYAMGFSRLSCVFCVNGRMNEHEMAAAMKPELAHKIALLEREVGKAYRMKQIDNVKYPKYFDEYLTELAFC